MCIGAWFRPVNLSTQYLGHADVVNEYTVGMNAFGIFASECSEVKRAVFKDLDITVTGSHSIRAIDYAPR